LTAETVTAVHSVQQLQSLPSAIHWATFYQFSLYCSLVWHQKAL